MFVHDGRYHLAIGPDWEGLMRSHSETGRYDRAAYRRTHVIVSDDPLHFSLDDLVAVIDAHAAEVIVDQQGDSWMSHCGWVKVVSSWRRSSGPDADKTLDMPTLEDVVALARTDSYLAMVSTVRGDGTIQTSLVNAGVMPHPISGDEAVTFVTYGRAKRGNLRARPAVNVSFHAGWQ